VEVSRTIRCASFWDALVLGAMFEEQGVRVRRPDEDVPLSMVASGSLDGIKAAVAQFRGEFPRADPVIIEGEEPDRGAPEPSSPAAVPEPSHRAKGPEPTRRPPAPEPSSAPKPPSRAPAPEPSPQAPAPQPSSTSEPLRQAPAPQLSHRVQAPEPSPQAPAPQPSSTSELLRQAPAPQLSHRVQAPEPSSPPTAPEPSWGSLLATTVRLWAQRQRGRWWPTQARSRLAIVAALTAVVFVTGGVIVELSASGQGKPTASGPGGGTAGGAGALAAAEATRQQAAAWVASQANPDAIVACDPAMCAALQAGGVPASRLLVLTRARADPLGSDLVVATPAIRGQFGARLAGVYAPVTLAAFGSGATRIDVRVVAPGGAGAYRAQLAADLRARRAAGATLLHNHGIQVAGAARAALAGGEVDPRLLVTLAALSHLHPIEIVKFGGSGPGASAGVPLRSADIAGAVPPGGGRPASPASLRAFFRAQWPPYLPPSLETIRITPRRPVLRVEYRVPCPLGLLGTRS